MNFLPIARLEMRRAARQPMTYYARALTGLLTISTGLGFVFAGFHRAMSAASAGQAVFWMLTGSGYVLLAAQVILLTCDCVSQEKRAGTLGLLFLTDLDGFDIVAGKLTAQVIRSLYCLMAAFPAFGFCIILGGVGLGDFVKVALALLNTLFYFAALGILISACVWRERTAAAWGGLALLFLGALLPILSMVCASPLFLTLIPAGAVLAALGASAGLISPPPVATALLVPHALGWLFIGAASYLVPRSWRREAPIVPVRRAAPTHPTTSASLEPLPWFVEPAKPLLITSLLVLICAVTLAGALLGPAGTKNWAAPVTIVLLHSVLKFQAASLSSRMLAGKRQSGELELLLTTPYDEDKILDSCMTGLKRSLFWPTLFALAVDSTLLILGFLNAGFGLGGLGWAFLVVAEVIWALLNLFSLSWVGLFLGLKLASPAKAAGRAILYVVLLPWGVMFSFAALAAMLRSSPGMGDVSPTAVVIFVLSLLFCNSYFTGWAINDLRDRFRFLAAQTWTRS